jgi:hypothetical protein
LQEHNEGICVAKAAGPAKVSATTGTVRDPAIQTAVTAMLARVARLPHVQAVTSPYGPRGAGAARPGPAGLAGPEAVAADAARR